MWKIESLRLAEAGCAVALGGAMAYLFAAPEPVAWLAGTAGVAALAVFFMLSPWRDAAVRDQVYGDAHRTAAQDIKASVDWAMDQGRGSALPEHAKALRDDIGAVKKDIVNLLGRMDMAVGDMLLDHLDAHDLRAHAEAHRARLEGVLERAAAARRLLAEDPGPAPVAPVARLTAKRAVAAPPPSAASSEALEHLHQQLAAGGGLPS